MFDSLLPLKLHLSRTLASKSLIWRVLVPNHWVPGNIVHEFHWVLPTKSRVKAVNPRIPALRGNYKQKTLRISRTQGDSRRLKETQGDSRRLKDFPQIPWFSVESSCSPLFNCQLAVQELPTLRLLPQCLLDDHGPRLEEKATTIRHHWGRFLSTVPGGTRGNPGELGELSPKRTIWVWINTYYYPF